MTLSKHFLAAPRMRKLPSNRSSIVAVLDVGSSKFCCIIAKLKPSLGGDIPSGRTHAAEIIGIGHQAAHGVKAGTIVNMDSAELGIRSVVDTAERMAGVTLDRLILNVSCGRIRSDLFTVGVSLRSGQVQDSDIRRLINAAKEAASSVERTFLHVVPMGFSLDGSRGICDPLGMVGLDLSADVHIVSAESTALRNLALCVSRCHLSVEAFAVTPYASALSCLVPDEMRLGIALIDIGAETTSVSIFYRGRLVYSDVIPIGGAHVTSDIARGLSISLIEAERLKTLYGGVFAVESDQCELISVRSMGNDSSLDSVRCVSRSALINIIRPRLEEIFELVRDRLAASPLARYSGGHFVLTGGSCQLSGIVELGQYVLSLRGRIGRPLHFEALPQFAHSPSFATACGLIVYPQIVEPDSNRKSAFPGWVSSGNYLVRVGQWIRESF